ncbi:MBL fold metallo-hydrolase [Clostridium sp. BNL1100]|uniref:MBL fold metallo-hydrolase n=1 Tax=Clostridium sp. BNL1100 TaxID=755731 RepID=UPI00024A7B63|nr:MBL fold metallo-hydrolase [Clostridium sp. BNL1100]AEY65315.1 Zn-dependent hydrolase, glyoxylase [Clostridium sp. BNL1100]
MKISEGLAMLELKSNVPNVEGVMYPVIVWDENELVLIDTGLPGQESSILDLIEKEGVSPQRMTKVIITHHDMDHIGSLAEIVKTAESISGKKVEVLSHEIEKPYIQGELMPLKFTKEKIDSLKKQMEELPPEKRLKYQSLFSSNKPKVTKTLVDKQELPYCGGITIIHTPGHTLGHVCVYLNRYKTLLAGDGLNFLKLPDGEPKLTGPNPQFTYNMDEAVKSLKKILDYDIQKIVCYHCGLIQNNLGEQINQILD